MKEDLLPDTIPDELRNDPGAHNYVEYAEKFLDNAQLLEALYVTLRGVSHSDDNAEGKLLLARVFFRMDCIQLAVRELEELHARLPQIASITKLLDKIAPNRAIKKGAAVSSQPAAIDASETLAEGEFDFSEIEMMEDE